MNRKFTKTEIEMTNKNTIKYSNSLKIREMQWRFHGIW